MCNISFFLLTFLQSFPDLDWISRQVKVCVVGLQVTYRTVSSSHAEALNEQLCRDNKGKENVRILLMCTSEDVQELSDHNPVNTFHK